MPLPISLAHRLAERLAAVRKAETVNYLRPDGKTQVSVRYRDGKPVEIEKLLISTQHKEGAESLIPDDLWEHVVEPVLPQGPLRRREAAQELPGQPDRPVRDRRPGGRRRPDRAQDHRRHLRRHGAATAAARSAARTRRRSTARPPTRRATSPRTSSPPAWPTAARCRSPTRSASRTPFGDGGDVRHREGRARARSPSSSTTHFDLRPGAFREELRLHRPIYQKTAAYGHFGREDHDFTWERTDKAAALRDAAGASAPEPAATRLTAASTMLGDRVCGRLTPREGELRSPGRRCRPCRSRRRRRGACARRPTDRCSRSGRG